jgi:hypothetical protein
MGVKGGDSDGRCSSRVCVTVRVTGVLVDNNSPVQRCFSRSCLREGGRLHRCGRQSCSFNSCGVEGRIQAAASCVVERATPSETLIKNIVHSGIKICFSAVLLRIGLLQVMSAVVANVTSRHGV